MVWGSTASCRSVKCLTRTALSSAWSGAAMHHERQRAQPRSQIGELYLQLAGRHPRGEQHRQLVLANQVEQVKQHALVADAGMQVLHQQSVGGSRRAPCRPRKRRAASSRAAPDFSRQTLARCVLPDLAGPTTKIEACGQSGHRSMTSAAARLDWLMKKSSAPSAGRCGRSKMSCSCSPLTAPPCQSSPQSLRGRESPQAEPGPHFDAHEHQTPRCAAHFKPASRAIHSPSCAEAKP